MLFGFGAVASSEPLPRDGVWLREPSLKPQVYLLSELVSGFGAILDSRLEVDPSLSSRLVFLKTDKAPAWQVMEQTAAALDLDWYRRDGAWRLGQMARIQSKESGYLAKRSNFHLAAVREYLKSTSAELGGLEFLRGEAAEELTRNGTVFRSFEPSQFSSAFSKDLAARLSGPVLVRVRTNPLVPMLDAEIAIPSKTPISIQIRFNEHGGREATTEHWDTNPNSIPLNPALNDEPELAKLIGTAKEAGGNLVGEYTAAPRESRPQILQRDGWLLWKSPGTLVRRSLLAGSPLAIPPKDSESATALGLAIAASKSWIPSAVELPYQWTRNSDMLAMGWVLGSLPDWALEELRQGKELGKERLPRHTFARLELYKEQQPAAYLLLKTFLKGDRLRLIVKGNARQGTWQMNFSSGTSKLSTELRWRPLG